jgi:hypothetical protein
LAGRSAFLEGEEGAERAPQVPRLTWQEALKALRAELPPDGENVVEGMDVRELSAAKHDSGPDGRPDGEAEPIDLLDGCRPDVAAIAVDEQLMAVLRVPVGSPRPDDFLTAEFNCSRFKFGTGDFLVRLLEGHGFNFRLRVDAQDSLPGAVGQRGPVGGARAGR